MQQVRLAGGLTSTLLLTACVAEPRFQGPIPVRNQHPAQLTVLHLPTAGTTSLPMGRLMVRGDAAYSNLFLIGSTTSGTRWEMDGEYLRTAAGVRAGLGHGLELGIELPFAHTSGGFLDSFVMDYHDAFGLPDQGRQEHVRDQFAVGAARNGIGVWSMETASFELMDLPLTLTWQVTDPAEGVGLALRTGVELPTGDDDKGYGNGEFDASGGVVLEHRAWGMAFYGHAQHTFAGTPQQSRDAGFAFEDVTSIGAAAELPLADGVSALMQTEWETSTLRGLDLAAADRDQMLLWVGGRIRIDTDTELELGFGEDLIGLVSPDFTVWLAMSWVPGASGR